ncbi:hypothetical protein [Metallosphaera sedula]|uniref:hypothetical protein n=1 Tax=Metallosphaera sedula TaxID=43687 RepID=UPI0020C1634F|nr:hypothetical protein [Metallosphaera sedula]BBL47847.1 hypothetical protein MJ1HA_1957 [Metallosphaera sedula]
MRTVNEILLAGSKIQKATKKGREVYFIFVPKDYWPHVRDKEWFVTVITKDREIPIGVRKPYRHANYLVITLSVRLKKLWDPLVHEKVDVILEQY